MFLNTSKILQCAKSTSLQKMIYPILRRSIVITNEIEDALSSRLPVVALESTIITHGMPYPHNLETALAVESIIREEGATPATIGILDGKIHVGLTHQQIEILAEKKKPCVKTSRRDLPYVLSKGINGGTTISGTMVIAHKVNIPIFVTGGIGGVHRGAETSLDISADLTELGRTPVCVVSAGVKSILDVGRTLEYLETQGVCVTVLGKDLAFPDFFTRDSGYRAPCHVETTSAAAGMIQKLKELGLNSGLLVAVPIPCEHEAEGQLIKNAIEKAVTEASSVVSGRDVTPFILQRVFEITGGQSLKSNIALIKNNARIGSSIAVEYSKLCRSSQPSNSFIPATIFEEPKSSENQSRPVVIGACIADLIAMVKEPEIKYNGMTHKGQIRQSYGGVGRNLADALTRLQCRPLLISAVGTDNHARALATHNPHMDCSGLARIDGASTATYCAILDSEGEALFGIGDMAIHDCVTPQHVKQFEAAMAKAPLVILDGNMSLQTISYVLDHCASCKVPVWYEPTDIQKATKPWLVERGDKIAFSSPNLNELRAMCSYLKLGEIAELPEEKEGLPELLQQLCTSAGPLLETMRALMVTLGRHGFVIIRRTSSANMDSPLLNKESEVDVNNDTDLNKILGLHFQSEQNDEIVSVSGAGDCLAAAFISGMLQGKTLSECSALGIQGASLSLQASPAVPESLSSRVLPWGKKHPFTVISL